LSKDSAGYAQTHLEVQIHVHLIKQIYGAICACFGYSTNTFSSGCAGREYMRVL